MLDCFLRSQLRSGSKREGLRGEVQNADRVGKVERRAQRSPILDVTQCRSAGKSRFSTARDGVIGMDVNQSGVEQDAATIGGHECMVIPMRLHKNPLHQ